MFAAIMKGLVLAAVGQLGPIDLEKAGSDIKY
jgi:hypothetical protein